MHWSSVCLALTHWYEIWNVALMNCVVSQSKQDRSQLYHTVSGGEAYHFDGLVQERCNSSALAMALWLSCTMPSSIEAKYSGTSRSIMWLLMLDSLCHQQQCHWLCTINGPLPSMGKNWNQNNSMYKRISQSYQEIFTCQTSKISHLSSDYINGLC